VSLGKVFAVTLEPPGKFAVMAKSEYPGAVFSSCRFIIQLINPPNPPPLAPSSGGGGVIVYLIIIYWTEWMAVFTRDWPSMGQPNWVTELAGYFQHC